MKITYTSPGEGDEEEMHSLEIEENGRTSAKTHLADSEVPSLDGPEDLKAVFEQGVLFCEQLEGIEQAAGEGE